MHLRGGQQSLGTPCTLCMKIRHARWGAPLRALAVQLAAPGGAPNPSLTAHAMLRPALCQVRDMIRLVKPQSVMVELCAGRAARLRSGNTDQDFLKVRSRATGQWRSRCCGEAEAGEVLGPGVAGETGRASHPRPCASVPRGAVQTLRETRRQTAAPIVPSARLALRPAANAGLDVRAGRHAQPETGAGLSADDVQARASLPCSRGWRTPLCACGLAACTPLQLQSNARRVRHSAPCTCWLAGCAAWRSMLLPAAALTPL